jgi:hypothetical protein
MTGNIRARPRVWICLFMMVFPLSTDVSLGCLERHRRRVFPARYPAMRALGDKPVVILLIEAIISSFRTLPSTPSALLYE